MTSVLAERELLGYPGCKIALSVDFATRDMAVEIHDPMGVLTWKPTTRKEAADMFFHPFVFGYKAPDLTTRTNLEDDGA